MNHNILINNNFFKIIVQEILFYQKIIKVAFLIILHINNFYKL